MTDAQLYLVIGVPLVTLASNVALYIHMSSQISQEVRGLRTAIELLTGKVSEIDTRLSVIEDRASH